jgi:hypothetical protein
LPAIGCGAEAIGGEGMICRIYDVPGATLEMYDEVDQKVGPEKPQGAHLHVAGMTEQGLRVIEVWDSVEDVDHYMQSGLGAALEEAQAPEPNITEFEVHKLDWVS